MELYEYTKKVNLDTLDDLTRLYVAKRIIRDVQEIAQRKRIPVSLAYEMYSKGIYK